MNGGAVFVIFLIGVMVVFGAGFLLAEDTHNAMTIETAGRVEATLAAQAATAEAVSRQAQAERDALAAKVVEIETERIQQAAVIATAQAELEAKEAARARMEGERDSALLAKAGAEAERDQAIREAARLAALGQAKDAEIARILATVTPQELPVAAVTPAVIPVTSGDGAQPAGAQPGSKTGSSLFMPWLGFAFFGMVIFLGAFAFGRGTARQSSPAQYAKDVTTVTMTVAEARAFARRKAQRKS